MASGQSPLMAPKNKHHLRLIEPFLLAVLLQQRKECTYILLLAAIVLMANGGRPLDNIRLKYHS